MNLQFPLAKIMGANLIPTAANTSVDGGMQAWSQMFLTWDWDGWVKPQIEHVIGDNIGCNCIRLIGANWSVIAGRFTQSYYDDKLLQVALYCAERGVYFYACCGDLSRDTVYDFSKSAQSIVANCFATTLMKLQQIPYVIGVDVIQEVTEFYGLDNARDLCGRLKALGVTLPLTCSVSENITPAAGGVRANNVITWADFLDVHLYVFNQGSVNQPLNKLQYFQDNYPEKNLVIGEWGTSLGADVQYQTSFGKDIQAIANQGSPQVRGALVWAASDQSNINGDKYGLCDAQFFTRQAKADLLRSNRPVYG